jgi:hypothetical protein
MPLAEEMLLWAGLTVPGNLRLPSDTQIRTTCPTCNEEQTLSEADVLVGDETVYTCKNGCQAILVIGPPGDRPWLGRGYRMGDWSFRNPADCLISLIDQDGRPAAGTRPILLPASPAALLDESERPD